MGALRLLRDRIQLPYDPAEAATDLESALSKIIGRTVHLSLYISPPRAVRKPVIQLIDVRGTTVAFAKLGVGPFTSGLVRAEADSLSFLASKAWRTLRIPAVLHASVWQGQQLLVLTAFGRGRSPAPDSPVLMLAMAEVARARGLSNAALAMSAYWRRLAVRIDRLAPTDSTALLRRTMQSIAAEHGQTQVQFGSWHGDWAPWNMTLTSDQVNVWDWEKFEEDVPVGFDAIHFCVQGDVVLHGTNPIVAFARTRSRAPDLLRWVGPNHVAADLLVSLYAMDIAVRYLEDGEDTAGDTQLGHVDRWLAPTVRNLAFRPPPSVS